ncbi:hypothetical protein GIB67_000037 [Kingdonia uniflora]|uniref:Uncharacterized protein n=1 Tax=Kingdonia uniflora TaxID=39325 RepID=A0A7J7MP84_9MAGN|nr:hypothetical protein GIB67_000037 [Kingdonia uniflora]
MADEVDLVGNLSPIIGVRDEEDTVVELEEWPRLKGFRVEYPAGSSWFREFCKAKSSIDGIWGNAFGYRGNFFRTFKFDYGLMLPLRNLAKSVMNMIGAYPVQLNCNFWEVILVCETLNERWAASGSEKRITAKDFLEYYPVKYVTTTDGAYLSSSSSRPCFFDLSSAGRVWNDNLLWVSGECLQRSDEEPLEHKNRTITKGISCKVLRKESFIDVVAREGTELEAVLKLLEISRFKRVASKDDKVRRSQAKRRMAGKTPGTMEEKLLTLELNTPLKLARLNEMPDGPVDMATVSSTIVQNLAKRKAVKRGATSRSITSNSVDDSSKRRKVTSPTKSQVVLEESDKIAEGADLRPHFEVEAGLLEEQCRAKAREKMVVVVDGEFKKFVRALSGVQLGLQDRLIELEKRISQLEGEKSQFEENLTWEIEVFQLELEKEREVVAQKLKEVRAESVVEAERLVTASATSRNNLAGKLYQLRMFVNIHSVLRQKLVSWLVGQGCIGCLELAEGARRCLREREEQILLYNAEYAEEYEDLISQYEDRLDDNVKLSLKHEEAKSQVEEMTATILSRDLALNQLTSKLAELKEKAMPGSQHEAELAEYHIRVLNDEISDMKCNIRVLNEQLLKKGIDLDTTRTDLAVSEADFEKLNSSIVGKDLELRNSIQIHDHLITRLDRLKADLRHLKEREAQSRADLAEDQAKNKSLVDDLAHARGNRELRVRELKYGKDLKFELNKRDGKIPSGEGSREMKEFLRRKEELVENMRIDLTNSRQKLIDLTRKMNERIDQLPAELVESKTRHLRDNKCVVVTHQSFKELVVHEQEKCDGEDWHQRQLSALVAFFVEEIKFLQVERDLMQDCFSGRTCVCKLDISSISPIGVMDRGIGTATAEQIARGKEIIA